MCQKKSDNIFNKEQVVNKLPNATSCFVGSTLVHTDKGLVPIEQLKVGDMALSMPESGPTKDKAYKRVVKTFKSKQKQPIMSPVSDIYCTDNHSFWTKDGGWKAAKFLDYFVDEVYHLDSEAIGYGYSPHYRVADPMTQHYYLDPYNVGGLYLLPTYVDGVAVCLESNNYNIASENYASLIDFRDGKQKIIYSYSNHTGFEYPYDSNHDKYDEIAKDIYRHV